jgi:hypothetical protein
MKFFGVPSIALSGTLITTNFILNKPPHKVIYLKLTDKSSCSGFDTFFTDINESFWATSSTIRSPFFTGYSTKVGFSLAEIFFTPNYKKAIGF